jgi:predicted glycogen debranching enzyme
MAAVIERSPLPTPTRPAAAEPIMSVARDLCANPDTAFAREWQVTNGIGGWASGSVGLANTRRYHGLLVAALTPPTGRTVLVASLDATARYAGRDWALSAQEYGGGHIHPRGFEQIERFTLELGLPVWRFALADARLSRRIWMAPGENTTYIRYTLEQASEPLEIDLLPLCTWRDYHAHARGSWPIATEPTTDGITVRAFEGARPYSIRCPGAHFRHGGDWYWNFHHRVEAERGLDTGEDLYSPGRFVVRLDPGASITLICSVETESTAPDEALARVRDQQRYLLGLLPAGDPVWIRQLALAADQFLVTRGMGGSTVIAGYPWFTDWGRDTMIALPGLTIAAGRPALAAGVLRTFAAHVSEGMLPNRFPDHGEAPEYNTVDATLWYFQAVAQTVAATGDLALARELLPVLLDIVRWHQRGTRYGIRVDAADGLLRAGEPGVQLTWMDAKVGDHVITPRIGKPVEVNALWINALHVVADLAGRLGDAGTARSHLLLAERTTRAFRERFWHAAGGYLHDVVDGPAGNDASLRPNQIFAVSLPAPLLDPGEARAVVAACAREFLTPVGLRSLARSNAAYAGHYAGSPAARDSVYHQGTVWGWLLGPFALAHYRVYRDAAAARRWLEPLADHLLEGCIGTISEIFDADAPFTPRGCPAQAWSVAETLRAWRELDTTT